MQTLLNLKYQLWDHILHQAAFAYSTLAFGNVPLLVCLYGFVHVCDLALRDIFLGGLRWHEHTDILGAFVVVAGAMLLVERSKWQARHVETRSANWRRCRYRDS